MSAESDVKQFAAVLTGKHGELEKVRCLNQRKIELIFEDGTVETVGGKQGLCCGYHGTGTRLFHLFLTECGFQVSMDDLENVKPDPDNPPSFGRSSGS